MIAWFIMLHQKPQQFEWLLTAIYNPDDLFLIHVDLKSLFNYKGRGGTHRRVRELISGKPNIRMMKSRSTNWGGWSLGRISLDAIDEFLEWNANWTHFINLSGDCYPTRALAEIRSTLNTNPEEIYVETKAFSDLPAGDWHPRRPRVVETPVKIVVLPGRRALPKDFEIEHKGSQWVILPRDFCEWQREAIFRRAMDRYMRFSPLSDELVVQTLLMNGPFRERQARHYGRAIRLVEPAPHPTVLTMNDLDFIHDSQAMFARKFDADVDVEILHTLASEIGAKVPAAWQRGGNAA